MLFPSPAVIELPNTAPIYARKVEEVDSPEGGTGVFVGWDLDSDNPHLLNLLSLNAEADSVTGLLASGRSGQALFRPLDPYDGVDISAAKVPHPLEVLRAHIIQGGGMAAQELSAVVMADNTVATLLLDTGVGTYVRLSGDWQLLNPTSSALENCEVVTVTADALPIFDKADSANTTLNVFDLPRDIVGETVLPADVGTGTVQPNISGEPLAASGIVIPVVASAGDLPAAIRMAQGTPSIRWYISKRAAALGCQDMIPKGW